MSYDVERSCYVSAVTPWSATADGDREQRDVSKRLDSETKVWYIARTGTVFLTVSFLVEFSYIYIYIFSKFSLIFNHF